MHIVVHEWLHWIIARLELLKFEIADGDKLIHASK